MKIRIDFITNSSSSSFIIGKSNITLEQMEKINNHIEWGRRLGLECAEEDQAWQIYEEKDFIKLETYMDNFDMRDFLLMIGILPQYIHGGHW